RDLLKTLPTLQVRMKHIADDRAWTNDRDLHDDVVKTSRFCFRQEGDLCTALDLEHSDRVAFLKCIVNFFVVIRDAVKVELNAVMLAYQLDRIAKHRHHPQ